MRFPNTYPVKTGKGLPENSIIMLMRIMSSRDGVSYTSFTSLNFSRPALCLVAGNHQITLSVESAKQILKESSESEE
jgi:hypothetical protein